MENNFGKENRYHGDPSLPRFKFTGEDKEKKIAELKAQGVPDTEIPMALEMAADIITNKQARAKVEKEMGK